MPFFRHVASMHKCLRMLLHFKIDKMTSSSCLRCVGATWGCHDDPIEKDVATRPSSTSREKSWEHVQSLRVVRDDLGSFRPRFFIFNFPCNPLRNLTSVLSEPAGSSQPRQGSCHQRTKTLLLREFEKNGFNPVRHSLQRPSKTARAHRSYQRTAYVCNLKDISEEELATWTAEQRARYWHGFRTGKKGSRGEKEGPDEAGCDQLTKKAVKVFWDMFTCRKLLRQRRNMTSWCM